MDRILRDIYKNENYIINGSYGLLTGASGYALLLYVIKEKIKLYNVLRKIIDNFEKRRYYTLYSHGVAGLLWVLNFINEDEEIDYLDDVIDTLHELLLVTITDDIKKDVDFLHGMSGIIHYLIDYGKCERSKEVIINYLNYLNQKSIINPKGIHLKFYNSYRKKYTNNFSLSHGLSAVIQILSRIFLKKIETNISEKLVNGYINFILSNKHLSPDQIGSVFPNSSESIGNKSRLAWCYGDLGIAISIWQAGKNLRNYDLEQEAEKIFYETCKRKTLNEGNIFDPMFCHGTIGIVSIYDRMWKNTNNELFLNSRDHWLKVTHDFRIFNDGAGGYKYYEMASNTWKTNYSLLEGAIGIALVLSSINSECDYKWDRAFLLSN